MIIKWRRMRCERYVAPWKEDKQQQFESQNLMETDLLEDQVIDARIIPKGY
jgi:hypothetical protein